MKSDGKLTPLSPKESGRNGDQPRKSRNNAEFCFCFCLRSRLLHLAPSPFRCSCGSTYFSHSTVRSLQFMRITSDCFCLTNFTTSRRNRGNKAGTRVAAPSIPSRAYRSNGSFSTVTSNYPVFDGVIPTSHQRSGSIGSL